MIIVNARFLTQNASGVQRFAFEVSRRLKKLSDEFIFVSPPDIVQHEWSKEIEPLIIGKTTGHHWEQTTLKTFLKERRSPLLIDLANTGPLNYDNQIVVLHDTAFFAYKDSFKLSFRLWYQHLTRHLSRRVKRIITVSETSKSEIEKYLPAAKGKIDVVHNGFTLLETNDKILVETLAKQKYFLAVGNLDPRKNLQRLISAFNLAGFPADVKLKIAGTNSKVFSKNAMPLTPNVELLDYQHDSELAALYSNAIAFVFPSLYEGFGLPVLEAMSLRCPTILSDIPVLHEIAGDTALYVNPLDVKSIKDGLTELAENRELAEKLRQLGYEQAKKYSWENTANTINDIIQNVIDNG
jgi:glycosyltransferase involved in cell wall biosynthesis